MKNKNKIYQKIIFIIKIDFGCNEIKHAHPKYICRYP